MPQLRVLLGFQQGQVYSLDSRPMIIGREPGSDIVLDPESPASRRHAEILCESGEWTIRDLDSRNGTLINGSPVKCGALNHSDEILVGDSVFVFEYNDRLTAETEAAASRALPREPLGLQNDPKTLELVRLVAGKMMRLERELARLVGSQSGMIRDILIAILAGGHCLLFGLSERAKTVVLNVIGSVLGLRVNRQRMRPDMSLADITGTDVKESPAHAPRLQPGPIFSQIFMAEDINRSSPDNLSALFSAMREKNIVLAERTWPVSDPFCALLTQDDPKWDAPFPMKPHYLDEIMFSLRANPADSAPVPESIFEGVVTAAQVVTLRALVKDFAIDECITRYAVRLTCATRPHNAGAPAAVNRCVETGAGPNAALALLLAAKARAILACRLFVTTDDVRAVASGVFRHRIALNQRAMEERRDEDYVVRKIIDFVPTDSEP